MNASHAPDVEHKTGYWWFMMAVMGGLSLTFNLWMVISPPPGISAGEASGSMALGIITHGSPVLLSALASHGFKTPLLGPFARGVIIALFLGFMGMSISTQAMLLIAALNLFWVSAWFLPLAIDTLALISLRAILTAHRLNKEAQQARDIAAERAAVERDIRPDIELDIRRQFEARMPEIRKDITAAVWRDIWAAIGEDIPAHLGGDTAANLPVLVERVQEEFLDRKEVEFAERERLAAARWEAERIDVEDRIRQEEQEAALARWEEQEAALMAQIEFSVRKELRGGSASGGRQKAITAQGSTSKVSMEKGLEIVRQAMLAEQDFTNGELAAMIGRDTKTVIRYKKRIKAEMEGGGGVSTDTDDDDGASQTSGYGRLRAM